MRETIQEEEEIPTAGKKEMWGEEENGSQKRMRGEVKSASEMKIVIIIIMIRNEKKNYQESNFLAGMKEKKIGDRL